MTNLDLIKDALREIGVIDAYRDPHPEDAALALRKLNQLMYSLEADTVYLGYFSQTSVNDDLPLSDADAAAIVPILAMSLTVNYPSARFPEMLPLTALDNRNRLLRDAVKAAAEVANLRNMPLGDGHGGYVSIIE